MYFLGITTNKLCKEFVWWTKTYSNGIQYHRVRGLKKTERKNYGSHPQIMEDNTVIWQEVQLTIQTVLLQTCLQVQLPVPKYRRKVNDIKVQERCTNSQLIFTVTELNIYIYIKKLYICCCCVKIEFSVINKLRYIIK